MSIMRKGSVAWNKGKPLPQIQGEKHGHWTGGKTIDKDGYVLIYVPDRHPFGRGRDKKYVLEHRLIMEKHIGRYLTPQEVVHHIDENKQNNSIDNIMLFPNKEAHRKYHKMLKNTPSQLTTRYST